MGAADVQRRRADRRVRQSCLRRRTETSEQRGQRHDAAVRLSAVGGDGADRPRMGGRGGMSVGIVGYPIARHDPALDSSGWPATCGRSPPSMNKRLPIDDTHRSCLIDSGCIHTDTHRHTHTDTETDETRFMIGFAGYHS